MPFGKETGKKARNQQIRARQENQNALQRAWNHIRHFTHFVIADIGPKFQYNQYQQLTIQQIFITEINNLISIGGETSDCKFFDSKYPMKVNWFIQ